MITFKKIRKLITSFFPLVKNFRVYALLNDTMYILQKKIDKYPIKLWYKPRNISIEVTSKCNLRCPACGISNIPDHMKCNLSIKTFLRLVPFFRYTRNVSLFNYGEPFMNPEFLSIIEICKAKKLEVSFFTNGMMLTDDIIKKLIELKVQSITFSIDGATESTYRKIRPDSNFEKVITNLKKLQLLIKSYNYPTLSICFTIMKSNIEDMPLMVELANRLKVKNLHFQNIIPFNKIAAQQMIFGLDTAYVENIFSKTIELANKYKIELRLPKIKIDSSLKPICSWPWEGIQIRSDGLIFICNCFCYPMNLYGYVKNGVFINEQKFVELKPIGNIEKDNVLEIWNGKEYQSLRKNLREKKYVPVCDECIYPWGIH